MGDLVVSTGSAARTALCHAFDSATRSIDAEFYSLRDPAVIERLVAAAKRHVHVVVRIEADPHRYGKAAQASADRNEAEEFWLERFAGTDAQVIAVDSGALLHAKAALVDGQRLFVSTGNPTESAFNSPGEVLIEDDSKCDIVALRRAFLGLPSSGDARLLAGPHCGLHDEIRDLLRSPNDVRIATEDLSDKRVISQLRERAIAGHHDRVLINRGATRETTGLLRSLLRDPACSSLQVREPARGHMHEKLVDTGDRIYVGSANLTYNGEDEANEAGIVADARDFADGSRALTQQFDDMWNAAQPLRLSRRQLRK